ncbi:DUF1499 domain-containing protein [Azospirillum sp.]|uniref:DUF1499 domain-containing protein n=1 Tax=Azospirillum sp. TaxID=34012 RepID=UPI002D3BA4E5|nr:DUF1499 domain-containing protein [Azospirillum sp.]HYD69076.1 DUF1499 domain-containing protein [Azospirillum sp.]
MKAIRILLRAVLVLLLVPVLAYGGLALAVGRDGVWETLFGPGDQAPVAFETLTPPDRPNHHLVCPPGLCRTADGESPVFPVGVEVQAAVWNRLLEREGARRLGGPDGQIDVPQMDVEVRTPWLRFPDLVTVRPIALGPDRSTVALYSRSLYGHSDLGTNAARLRAWLAAMEAELGRIATAGVGGG